MVARSLSSLIIFAVLSVSLIGCGPRGETLTLDEVLANAKQRYSRISAAGAGQDVQLVLGELQKGLDTLSSGDMSAAQTELESIATNLNKLVSKAGYTVRPSLGEMLAQYRTLSQAAAAGSLTVPQLKLLTARTYELLASEMETTKFGV
jgi:hypothetical protein